MHMSNINSASYYPQKHKVPLNKRRGLEHSDGFCDSLLINSNCKDVVRSLISTSSAFSCPVKDPFEQEIYGNDRCAIAYQLVGHDWTIVEFPDFQSLRVKECWTAELVEPISRRNSSPTILYRKNDGIVFYVSYVSGNLREAFLFFEDDFEQEELTRIFSGFSVFNSLKLDNCLYDDKLEGFFFFYSEESQDISIETYRERLSYFSGFDVCKALLDKYSLYLPLFSWNMNQGDSYFKLRIEGLSKKDFLSFFYLKLSEPL